jgi:P27 family predicted phage terminase small subunit
MGRRGPPPKPTHLRSLDGDHPSRINRAEPQPRRDAAPVMPEWFGPDERAVWERVVAELKAMSILRAADQDMIAAYCVAVCRWATASQVVAAEGVLLDGRSGVRVKNPAVGIAAAASLEITRLCREFGFSPASRTAIEVSGAGRRRDGDPEEFFAI